VNHQAGNRPSLNPKSMGPGPALGQTVVRVLSEHPRFGARPNYAKYSHLQGALVTNFSVPSEEEPAVFVRWTASCFSLGWAYRMTEARATGPGTLAASQRHSPMGTSVQYRNDAQPAKERDNPAPAKTTRSSRANSADARAEHQRGLRSFNFFCYAYSAPLSGPHPQSPPALHGGGGGTPPGYEREPAAEGYLASGCAKYSCRKIRSLIAVNAGWDSGSEPIHGGWAGTPIRECPRGVGGTVQPEVFVHRCRVLFPKPLTLDANASHLASMAWASISPTSTAKRGNSVAIGVGEHSPVDPNVKSSLARFLGNSIAALIG
jgi:hypothetical protein